MFYTFVLETSLSIYSRTGPKGVIWCIMHWCIPIACVYSLHMYLYTCIPVYCYNLLYIVFNINHFSLACKQMAQYLRISLNVPQDIWISHWQWHLVEVLYTIFGQHAWTIMEIVWVRNCLAPDDKLQIRIKFVICTKWPLLDTVGWWWISTWLWNEAFKNIPSQLGYQLFPKQ